MKIRINGEIKVLDQPMTVESLLSRLSLKREAVVCELNRLVVDKNSYSQIYLNDNDNLEIVHFVGGG